MLGGAIDELPADYRTAFLLHDVEGLSNPEIAETLQIKLGTVKSRVQRARLFLRRRLADYMGGSFGVARVTEFSRNGVGDGIDRKAAPVHHRNCSLLASV